MAPSSRSAVAAAAAAAEAAAAAAEAAAHRPTATSSAHRITAAARPRQDSSHSKVGSEVMAANDRSVAVAKKAATRLAKSLKTAEVALRLAVESLKVARKLVDDARNL
jgi:hypothetical protein